MPIGVPKVPFRLPGEPAAQWVDLYNRLYRERVLFLCQDLDDELANQLIGIMLYLNAEEKSKGLFIYINSPGGSVTCGIAVYDTMNYVKADVTTICVGTAASMASFVLAGEVMRIRRQVGKIYAERTGQSLSRISRDMDRDQFMSAREAKEYGLVDQVAVDKL